MNKATGDTLQEQALETVSERYNRRVMNNIHRAEYLECLVAALLGPDWILPWKTGYDWAPWDLEHISSGTRIEIKQSAAYQPWHSDDHVQRNSPRYDISPRKGYWTRDSQWIDNPGRPAHIYIFAWHPVTDRELVDHRMPEQWIFHAAPSGILPARQGSISLSALERLDIRKAGPDSLASILEQLQSTCC